MARRKDDSTGAGIALVKDYFTKLVKRHPEFKIYNERWEYKRDPKDTITIPVRRFNVESLQTLYDAYKAAGSAMGDRWQMGQIAAHIKVIQTSGEAKIEQLRSLETAIIAWAKKGIIRGWCFARLDKETAGIMQAMQIQNVAYHPKVVYKDYVQPAYVQLDMNYWEKDSIHSTQRSWRAANAIGHTVTELLTEAGVFHETAELIEAYDKEEKEFLEWRVMLGEQFVGHGNFDAHDDGDHRHRRSRGADSEMNGVKLIIDDEAKAIDNNRASGLFLAAMDDEVEGESVDAVEDAGSEERLEDEEAAEKFSRLPLSTFIWCFNLYSYNNGWVHTRSIKPYVYRPELRNKLILPVDHGELIDVLTADMGVLMEDIVSGKSGGTAILCQGRAGTGKTLTAEVYSEVVKRPLYRVHSGQLGTDAGTVESALKKALENAMRWRAVLLIDEADVFISARGDDLEKNAVIGVFLRTLEYYNGLLFMTTNRADTIDEAILSRCIAQIRYDSPGDEERAQLWLTLADVYGMKMVADKSMAQKLAKAFPEATGRDIKGLIKLVTKYSRRHDKKPTMEDFKRLAVFKNIKTA